MGAGNDLIVLQNKSSNDTVELAHHDTLVRLVARVGSRAISRVGSAPERDDSSKEEGHMRSGHGRPKWGTVHTCFSFLKMDP